MMRKVFYAIILLFIVIGCSEKTERGVVIKGEIEGLKVGKLYLQQLKDTILINLDSLEVDGEAEFRFHAPIEEPQMLYLYLDKKDRSTYDDRLALFTDDSIMVVKTSLEDFEKAEVSGSKNQELYNEFMANKRQLDGKQVELMQIAMRLQEKDTVAQDSLIFLEKEHRRLLESRYRYTLNFAQQNAEKEVAPYVLLSEALGANPVWLDSIYRTMSPDVQNGLYGRELKSEIDSLKNN